MKNVGESSSRNESFKKSFSRSSLIKSLVADISHPMIIDVGGNNGQSVNFFRELFPDSIIHSFEPDPQSFKTLSALADQNTYCHNIALSDCEGETSFYQNEISHTNSLYEVNLNSKDSIYFNKVENHEENLDRKKFNQKINVTARRLDRFCEGCEIQEISLLKIDVQGAEGKMLLGAGNLLECVDNIILEVSFFDYYVHQSSFFEIEKILVPYGFRLFSISEISNNPMNGRTDWAEVIYRR